MVGLAIVLLYYLKENNRQNFSQNKITQTVVVVNDTLFTIHVKKNITVKHYFEFIDSLVTRYDSLTPYSLTEHLLVRANPRIIDRLQNTDYYRMKAKDSFVYNQREMVVLKKNSVFMVPVLAKAEEIISSFQNTIIDVNIPEYKLRIYEDSVLLYEFPIRVGRNEKKYLKMGNRVTDLRTITGTGSIVDHIRNPDYYDPVNGKQYFSTTRDDKKVTRLPQIPFIETEINGIRNGQMIHPTTNPISLGKPYSNGCIATNEAAAWLIYYHATLGTKININYNLTIVDESGEQILLEDIYGYQKN
ncbi:L,D-transpeptidase [Polaribacter litorisediminis]|nr:L,D-transpeptidase [Polaribacter litorisediminis]